MMLAICLSVASSIPRRKPPAWPPPPPKPRAGLAAAEADRVDADAAGGGLPGGGERSGPALLGSDRAPRARQ